MLKWTTETGETRYLAVHALPAWGGGSQCDPADLIAALKANAAACGEVTAAMGWVTDQALAVTGERAEQAERSLATVTAERDEAHAALRDCATRLGNGSAVSAQASHAFHCHVPTEVGIAVDALKAKLAEAERENLTLRNRIGIDRTSWHEAEAEVKVLRAKLAKTERVVEAAREDAQHCPHACSPPCPFDRAVARTRAALRALDSPVVAGTDSGGASGAATPEGGHAAPTGGPMPPPEPAGSSLEATRDLQAPATRAELDELRWRVERLENLTGSGSGSGSGSG